MHARPTAWRIIGDWLGRYITLDPIYGGLIGRLPGFGFGAQWSWWEFSLGANWGKWPVLYLGFVSVEFWRGKYE